MPPRACRSPAHRLALAPPLLQGNNASSLNATKPKETKPSTPKKVTTWDSVLAQHEMKSLCVDVLKNGGLCTVQMPYGEEGAVDKREAINDMGCEYLLREKLLNPMFLAEIARMPATSKNTTGLPTKVRAQRS